MSPFPLRTELVEGRVSMGSARIRARNEPRYFSRQGYRRKIAARLPAGASVITQHRHQFGLVLA